MTIKLIPEFWRNQKITEKFWKTYEQVKPDFFQIFSPPHLFLIIYFSFLDFAKTKHEEINIINLR